MNPVLSYACEIWEFSKFNEIERIHLKFLKSILNVKTTTFSASVYGELGRVELAWRSGSVMNSHATARGSIPGGNSVFTELHVLRKGQ